MKITAMKAQVRNPERVSIYVDDKYSFSLTQSQLLEHKLHSGLEIDEEALAKLKYASDYGKTLERVMKFIMIRPRSVREVRDYLWRKKADPDLAAAVMRRLEDRAYLNDANFAKSWVRARQLTKPVSKRRLTMELRQKGVTEVDINQAFEQEKYDEKQALHEIITKKRRQLRYQDDIKLMQYLARQGFSYDIIKQALQ